MFTPIRWTTPSVHPYGCSGSSWIFPCNEPRARLEGLGLSMLQLGTFLRPTVTTASALSKASNRATELQWHTASWSTTIPVLKVLRGSSELLPYAYLVLHFLTCSFPLDNSAMCETCFRNATHMTFMHTQNKCCRSLQPGCCYASERDDIPRWLMCISPHSFGTQ